MDQPPPKESRVPINLRIKFRSESVDQFIDRYAIDVSRGGIFIRTREPLAVGTQLRFDFRLQDSSPLIAGEGTVVWIREHDANRAGITPGMGVRFDKLTPGSQPVLEKILAEKGRRDQGNASGGIMSKVGAGMAVRRPSSTFTALDPRAASLASPIAGSAGETPSGGIVSSSDAANLREPRPSSSPLLRRTPPTGAAASISERTNQGFAPSAQQPPRARTPGPLPPLETPGSGRHVTGAQAPSARSRPANFEAPSPADIDKALDGLTGGDGRSSANEPTPVPPSLPSGAGEGVPMSMGDGFSEPTRTGAALSDIYSGSTNQDAADRNAAIAAAAAAGAGTVDGAAPTAEIDADRTLATSAADVAQIVASERAAAALESAAKDVPVGNPGPPPVTTPDTPAPAPALVLIKSDAAVNSDKAAEAESVIARDEASVRQDEVIASHEAPPSNMIASSSSSPTAAGSFTVAEAGEAVSSAGGSAPRLPGATKMPAGGAESHLPMAAKSGSARPAKRKSAAPFFIVGLVAAGAIAAVVLPQQNAGDHSAESFQPRKSQEAVAPKTDEPTAPAVGIPAGVAQTAEQPSAAALPGASVAAQPSQLAEKAAVSAAPPANAAEAVPTVPPPDAAPATKLGRTRAEKLSGSKAKGKKAEAVEASAGQRPAVQHLLKITSSPAGAEVLIDGQPVGTTPYQGKEIDADSPHALTIRLNGYEPHEHTIGASDWSKQKANLRTVKVSVKLRKAGAASKGEPTTAATTEIPTGEPANAAEPPLKPETNPRAESKDEPAAALPVERPVEKMEKTTQPPSSISTEPEPTKAKDAPAAPAVK